MARTTAGLPAGIRLSDHISLGVIAKTFPLAQVQQILAKASKLEHNLPAQGICCKVSSDDRVAWISGTDVLPPTPVWVQAMRTDFGRPSSSMRLRARTAMATEVA